MNILGLLPLQAAGHSARLAVLVALAALLSACAATRQAPEHTLPQTSFRAPISHQVDAEAAKRIDENSMLYVYDPIEGMNRRMYNFNAMVDRAIFVPVATGYQAVVPRTVRSGVSNVIGNLNEVPCLANSALQGNPDKVNVTLIRFVTNTILGVGGMFDVATDLGFEREDEDFGQTLSVWGVPNGAYVVLPFYGPSSVRDTVGTAGDMVFSYYQMEYIFDLAGVSDHSLASNVNTAVRAVNTRSETPFRYYTTDTPFEYDVLRFAYTKARVLQALD